MKNYLFALTMIALMFMTIAWAQSPSLVQWEYKLENHLDEKKANRLGTEGWELSAIQSPASESISAKVVFVFKRRIN